MPNQRLKPTGAAILVLRGSTSFQAAPATELHVRPPEATAMGHAESSEPQPPRPAGIPRWLAIALSPIVGLVGFPAVHAGIPWVLSHLGPRYGWDDGGPAGWNLLGYAPVAVGAALLVWITVF